MSVNPTAKLTGYFNRGGGTLYRFEESPQGEHAVISATCPNLPELPYWSFLAAFPWAARSVLQLPKTPGGPEIIATVVTPLAKEEPTKLLETKCKLIGRVTGTITKVDLDQLIAKFRRNDRPIHVYRSFEELPGGYSPAKANAATPTH